MAAPKTRASRQAPEVDEAEAAEETTGGLGFDDGIVLTTTLLLGGAVILAWLALGAYPG